MNTNPEKSVFTRIIERELPAEILFETDEIIVIKSIQPLAPVHLLGITKHPYLSMHALLDDDNRERVLWHLGKGLHFVAEKLGLDKTGYRLVTNIGINAGQEVPHLHIHLLGGAPLGAIT